MKAQALGFIQTWKAHIKYFLVSFYAIMGQGALSLFPETQHKWKSSVYD